MSEQPKKLGRPSIKTDELINEICERIAEGRSVASVAQDDDMPDHKTIWRWMNSDEAFCQKYARAIQARAMTHADRISDISSAVLAGKIPPDAARVALDGMKWTAARLLPKVYGDKQTIEASVTHTHTLHLEALKELANRGRGNELGSNDTQVIDLAANPTFQVEMSPSDPPALEAVPAPVSTSDPPGSPSPRGAGSGAPPATHTDKKRKQESPPSPRTAPTRARAAKKTKEF